MKSWQQSSAVRDKMVSGVVRRCLAGGKARRLVGMGCVTMSATKILLISLSGDVGRALEAIEGASKTPEVEVLWLGELPNAARRLLRQRHPQFAIAGAPPADELGYGLTPGIALV